MPNAAPTYQLPKKVAKAAKIVVGVGFILALIFMSDAEPVELAGLFMFGACATWVTGDGHFAFIIAGMVGLYALAFVIGNGFKPDIWYGLGAAAALACVGCLRNRLTYGYWQLPFSNML